MSSTPARQTRASSSNVSPTSGRESSAAPSLARSASANEMPSRSESPFVKARPPRASIFVPLMPTTIFVILAAGCFARSNRRVEDWLLNHKRFGPTIRAWRAEGAISRRGKTLATGGMVLGYVLFLIGARPDLPLALFVLAVFVACAWYVLSRPEPKVRS